MVHNNQKNTVTGDCALPGIFYEQRTSVLYHHRHGTVGIYPEGQDHQETMKLRRDAPFSFLHSACLICVTAAAAIGEHRGGGEYHHQGTHLPGQRLPASRRAYHPADLLQTDDLATNCSYCLLLYEEVVRRMKKDLQVLSGGCWW